MAILIGRMMINHGINGGHRNLSQFSREEDDIKHGMERGLFRILSCKAEVSLHSSNQAWLAGKSPMEF